MLENTGGNRLCLPAAMVTLGGFGEAVPWYLTVVVIELGLLVDAIVLGAPAVVVLFLLAGLVLVDELVVPDEFGLFVATNWLGLFVVANGSLCSDSSDFLKGISWSRVPILLAMMR